MSNQLLRIYLQDHFAGSKLGLALARRTARSNRRTAFGPPLERLAAEIADDRQALAALMAELGVRRPRMKPALALVAERAGRLKLNGRLVSYSPLSRVFELEGLAMGVRGKQALWRALGPLGCDVSELERRAEAQLAELDRLHAEATRLALSGERKSAP
jgi:hypothetical protein